jgi:hypothetical protein
MISVSMCIGAPGGHEDITGSRQLALQLMLGNSTVLIDSSCLLCRWATPVFNPQPRRYQPRCQLRVLASHLFITRNRHVSMTIKLADRTLRL